jgi:hypothetical protein
MNLIWPMRFGLQMVAAALVAAGAMTGGEVTSVSASGSAPATAGASSTGCQSWVTEQPPSPGSRDSRLRGVAVLSSCDAWAVGSQIGSGASRTLIEHWDGAAWSVVASPNPGVGLNLLNGVRASSPASVWAVGRFGDSAGTDHALIEHWDGTTWSVVPSPSPAGSELTAVRVVSARDVWAVGDTFNGTSSRTLILHWNGAAWRQVASPNPGHPTDSDVLAAVTATSATSAWAVGESTDGTTFRTLILRWNGARWTQVPSPSPGTRSELLAVAATSAANAWAAGAAVQGGKSGTLILRWNGKTWSRSPSPGGGSGTDSFLTSLSATSPASALAVGGYSGTGNPGRTLVLRWSGSAWRRVPSPDPGPSGSTLYAVAASSAGNAWAVGIFRQGLTGRALAIHCC